MEKNLGALPFSTDIFTYSNIGLWALELDEFSPPRLYFNKAMAVLLSASEELTPEERYSYWNNNIDAIQYDEVHEAIEKMQKGMHCEFQYTWHCPDKKMAIFNCAGIRNFEYTKGVRIEGFLRDITGFIRSHLDKRFPLSRDEVPVKMASLRKKNAQSEDYESQLKETLIFTNSFLDTYLSAYYVNLYDCTYKIYKQNDVLKEKYPLTQNYYNSICSYIDNDVHPDDRLKLKEILKPDYLYKTLKKEKIITFAFTDISDNKEKNYRFQVIQGADSRHAAIGFSDITSVVENQQNYTNTMMSLSDNFQAVYDVDITTGKYTVYSENNAFADAVTYKLINTNDFFIDFEKNVEIVVFKDDYDLVKKNINKDNIKKLMKQDKDCSFEYRLLIDKNPQWFKIRVRKSTQNKNHFLLGIFYVNNERIKEKEMQEIVNGLASEFTSLFHVDAKTGKYKVYVLSDNNDIKKVMMENQSDYKSLTKYYVENYIHPDDKEKMMKYTDLNYVKKNLANKKSEHIFFRRYYKKDFHWFEQVIVKIQDKNEELKEFISYFTDRDKEVREDQENKRQLHDALEMAQSANRAKTVFLNNMSHDIRTPMNAIFGYTKLASTNIDKKEKVQDYLTKIEKSSNHLLNLINDVLDMSRIESGKMTIEEKEENLFEIIQTLQSILQADIDARKIDFSIDSCNVRNPEIMCDKLRLNQVLINILSNAIKYTEPGGTVKMCVKQINTKTKDFASFVFSVKDTGIGMSKEFLKTIFDPFTRMQSSTVSGIQGTGLGMAITKEIVDMMKGKIEINSELNKGTEVILHFDFNLHKNSALLQKEQVENKKTVSLKDKKILLVDDNEFNREIALELFNDNNISVTTANDGVEALEKVKNAKKGDIDLILMDIQMPVMNGYEATKKIRELGTEVSKVPILAMTANAFEEDKKIALEAGMNDYITKPIDFNKLQTVIERIIN